MRPVFVSVSFCYCVDRWDLRSNMFSVSFSRVCVSVCVCVLDKDMAMSSGRSVVVFGS